MRIEIKGLHRADSRLADGTKKTYWYAWKGGPPLRGKPGSPEFIASYNEAAATREPVGKKTLGWLIRDYQKGGHFKHRISRRTRDDYTKLLDKIDKKFGDMPLKATERKETRGVFMRWRDQLSKDSVRQADYTFAVLSAVFSHGIDYGDIRVNPIAKSGRLYSGTRVDIIWTSEQVAAFLKVAPPHLHLPLLVGLWSGLHQGDILNLPWSAYDGKFIKVRQRKSVRRNGTRPKYLMIPVGEPLRIALDAAAKAKKSPLIMLNSDGKPWGPKGHGFRSSWRKASIKAGL